MSEPLWRLDEVEGVHLVRCTEIAAIARVAHAFSTRIAFGRTDFDLGPRGDDAHQLRSRTASFFRAAGFADRSPALLRQVHGGVIVDASAGISPPPAADGAIRVLRDRAVGPVPAVRTADCVAVLVADRHATAVAALHAGWRGVAAGIASTAVARFASLGVDSGDLVVAFGPAILGCCYEVGEEVVRALGPVCGSEAGYVERTASGRVSVDLHAALRQQMMAAGVPSASIQSAPWCTRCRTDLFFSFRGEGSGTGRLMAAVGPAAGP